MLFVTFGILSRCPSSPKTTLHGWLTTLSSALTLRSAEIFFRVSVLLHTRGTSSRYAVQGPTFFALTGTLNASPWLFVQLAVVGCEDEVRHHLQQVWG